MDHHSYCATSQEKKQTKKQKRKARYEKLSKRGHAVRYKAEESDVSASGTDKSQDTLNSKETPPVNCVSTQGQHGMDTENEVTTSEVTEDIFLTDTDASTDDPDYFPTPSKRHMLDSDFKGNSSISGVYKLCIMTLSILHKLCMDLHKVGRLSIACFICCSTLVYMLSLTNA